MTQYITKVKSPLYFHKSRPYLCENSRAYTMSILRVRLEEKIQQKHLLSHCFYQRWQSGQLALDELRGYVKEYYPFEREFPRYISSVHAQTEKPEHRKMLAENLSHEELGDASHLELWRRFAEGLGVSRSELENHFHSDETEHLLRTFRKSTSESMVDGLCSLYAYERQQPDVARTKKEGLKCFYGITDARPLSFFEEHQTVDVYHAETEARILEEVCTDADRAVAKVGETLDALYEFLDGVEKRYRVS